MSELNTVCISTDKYDSLMQDRFLLKQSESTIDNLLQYTEKLEAAIFDLIKIDSNFGEHTWKFKKGGKFERLISVLNAHDVDWSEGKPDEEIEELLEEICEVNE